MRFTRDGRRAGTERLNRYTQPLTVIIAAITGLSLSFFLSTPVFLSLLAVRRLFFPPCRPSRLRPPLTIIATVTRPSSNVYISHGDIVFGVYSRLPVKIHGPRACVETQRDRMSDDNGMVMEKRIAGRPMSVRDVPGTPALGRRKGSKSFYITFSFRLATVMPPLRGKGLFSLL